MPHKDMTLQQAIDTYGSTDINGYKVPNDLILDVTGLETYTEVYVEAAAYDTYYSIVAYNGDTYVPTMIARKVVHHTKVGASATAKARLNIDPIPPKTMMVNGVTLIDDRYIHTDEIYYGECVFMADLCDSNNYCVLLERASEDVTLPLRIKDGLVHREIKNARAHGKALSKSIPPLPQEQGNE